MQNKKGGNTFWIIIGTVFTVSFIVLAYFIWFQAPPVPAPAEENLVTYEIDREIYDSISAPKDFGGPILTDEAGFGRENPFAPYK